ncbi:MAG: DUF7208 family protein [Methylococcaceae bacterium]
MKNNTRTIYGAYLQSCQFLNLPVVLSEKSTLNEKFNVNAGIVLSEGEIPRVNYMAIGNAGHRAVVGADGITQIAAIPHLPRHGALYHHVPYLLRTPDNDLTAAERANYRLRVLETHNGVTYVAYYLKKLNLDETVPQMTYMTEREGAITSIPFAPTVGDLNPTAPPVTSTGVISTTGDYLSVTAQVRFTLTEPDMQELSQVAAILYDDPNAGMIISEMALCSGLDRAVPGNFNGTHVNYIDAVGVQVTHFIQDFYTTQFNATGIDLIMDIGAVEPLLVTSA